MENGHKIYIVSNKHVLTTSNVFRIGFIQKNEISNEPKLGEIKFFRIKYSDTFINLHPDDDIDIAIIDISGFIETHKDEIYLQALDYTMLASCTEDDLHVSQNVLFIGYPDGRCDELSNLPLVRSAIMASHPHLDFNGMRAFVIDGQVFPGSSGSPVIINLHKEKWSSGYDPTNQPHILILGIVSQTMIRNNKLQVYDARLVDGVSVEEVLGLGIVFKSTAIKDLIDIASQDYFGEDSKGKAIAFAE